MQSTILWTEVNFCQLTTNECRVTSALKIPVRIRIKKKDDPKSQIDFTVNDSRVLFKTAWNREVDVRKLVELDLLEPELFLSYWNGELDRFKLEENIKGKLNDMSYNSNDTS